MITLLRKGKHAYAPPARDFGVHAARAVDLVCLPLPPSNLPLIRVAKGEGSGPAGAPPLASELEIEAESYRSSGFSPVFRAMRASILGPISTLSWKAKTKSGQPARLRTRWEPDLRRLMLQPIRRRAASTRPALVAGHWLTPL